MLLIDKEIHKRIFSWFIIWYFIEALVTFLIVISYVFISGNSSNSPLFAFLIICGGSLQWPAIIFLSFFTSNLQNHPFFFLFCTILISFTASISIEWKYNISYPVLFKLNRRFNQAVLDEILGWFFIYYVLGGVTLFIMLFLTQSINNDSNLIVVLLGCITISIIWPFFLLIVSLLVDVSSSPSFLILFGLFVIYLIISPVLKFIFNVKFSKVFNLFNFLNFLNYPILSTLTRKIEAKGFDEVLSWFFIYYILSAIMFFTVLIFQLIEVNSNNLSPPEYFWACIVVSTVWPLIIFSVLFFLDVSPYPFFLMPFVLFMIWIIISLVLKDKFNVTFSKVFNFFNKTW